MTDNLGRAVLESGATAYEIALADTDADRLQAIQAELIDDNYDPYRVQTRNLLFLAFAQGVTLWDDDWPEATKRAWIAIQWRFKAMVGTETAFRIALGLWGYTLEDVVTPPQGFYAGRDLTPEERSAWIAKMPQLRIRRELARGTAAPDEWFAGQSFAGRDTVGADDSALLIGRRGFIRRNGVDTPLQSVITSTTVVNKQVVDIERIDVPGLCSVGFIAGVDFAGDEHYAGSAELEAETLTIRKDLTYAAESTVYGITSVRPSFTPLDVRWTQVSDKGDGGPYFYAGQDFAGVEFTADDHAADLLYDVLYLFDPAVAGPMTEGMSFAGVSRVGIEQKTAELLINLHTKAGALDFIAGQTFVGEGYAVDDDGRDQDNALRACVAAKALRDTILVSFEAKRPLQAGDTVDESTRVGAWVDNLL